MRRMAEKTKKPRKKNYTIDEERVLREKYAEHKDYLSASFTNIITNKGKKERRQKITDAVDAIGYEIRTVDDIKIKWKNMVTNAKGIYTEHKKLLAKTGGGPKIKEPSERVMSTIDLMKDTTSFKGIDGGLSVFRDPIDGKMHMLTQISMMQMMNQLRVTSYIHPTHHHPPCRIRKLSGHKCLRLRENNEKQSRVRSRFYHYRRSESIASESTHSRE